MDPEAAAIAVTEVTRLLAYAFQSSGRKRLLEEDVVRILAHDRRWLPPSRVRAAVQAGRAQGILRAAGAHGLELSGDLEAVRLPLDYRPDLSSLESALQGTQTPDAPPPLFRRILRRLTEATQDSEASLVARINEIQQSSGNLLRVEGAALVLARLHDLDVDALLDEFEASLQRAPTA